MNASDLPHLPDGSIDVTNIVTSTRKPSLMRRWWYWLSILVASAVFEIANDHFGWGISLHDLRLVYPLLHDWLVVILCMAGGFALGAEFGGNDANS